MSRGNSAAAPRRVPRPTGYGLRRCGRRRRPELLIRPQPRGRAAQCRKANGSVAGPAGPDRGPPGTTRPGEASLGGVALEAALVQPPPLSINLGLHVAPTQRARVATPPFEKYLSPRHSPPRAQATFMKTCTGRYGRRCGQPQWPRPHWPRSRFPAAHRTGPGRGPLPTHALSPTAPRLARAPGPLGPPVPRRESFSPLLAAKCRRT